MSDSKSDSPNEPKVPWAAVGTALGGIARRVGELVSDVSETVTVAERTREALARADEHRDEGRELDALRAINEARVDRPDDAMLLAAGKLTWCWAQLFGDEGQRFPIGRLQIEADGAPGEGEARDPVVETTDDLAVALLELRGDRPQTALDAVRRASRGREPWLRTQRAAHRVVLHTVASQTLAQLGLADRAIREVQRARAAAGPQPSRGVRATLMRLGASLLLADGRPAQAERWLDDLSLDTRGGSDDLISSPERAAFKARIYAARGDAFRAMAALDDLPDGAQLEARVRVALVAGDADRALQDALAWLQRGPEDPGRQRLWALAQFRKWRALAVDQHGVAPLPGVEDVVTALLSAATSVPKQLRHAHLEELAQVLLYIGEFEHDAAKAVVEAADHSEEMHLLAVRRGLARGEDMDAHFVVGPPPRLRRVGSLGGPQGPDEVSPLRDVDFQARTLDAQTHLAIAEWSLHRQRRDDAAQALVDALVEDPDSRQAGALLRLLAPARPERRLEACLADATDLLASVPGSVLGVSLQGVADGLGRVVAARERLARPLTIAIMGEFSSGKSSFVNALLGENVAPTGVLPTTSTINVFRHGPSGGARVHYRDGHIETLVRDQVEPFLHGLDDVAAARIRYVEIERTGTSMGDTAVVDTPGLNALDPYHEQVAREFLDEADAVVWIFSATRSGAASEGAMLESLRRGGRRVLGVLNKVDTLEPGEREELATYLTEQLGEVLADVVPLSATEAIAWRASRRSGTAQGADPFESVDKALDTHFLADARNLKRALTVRRLDEALDLAQAAVHDAVDRLEERATPQHGRDAERSANELLERFQDALERALLGIDDVLAREWLALGVVELKRGISRAGLDELDRDYLDAHFEELVVTALERSLREFGTTSDEASQVARSLGERFGPWARGHLAGALSQGYVTRLVQERGPAAAHGESELRAAIRSELGRFVQRWRFALDDLRRPVARDLALVRRRVHAAPRAEALRLRASVLAGIQALRERLEDVE